MDLIIAKLVQHVSSIAVAGATALYYLFGERTWLDEYLPENGKPLVVFLIIALVAIYEMLLSGQRQISRSLVTTNIDIASISVQLEVNRLKQDVNSIYFRIKSENVTVIKNENTIKEINELKDMRIRLGVNSYTQSRLSYLCSLIQL